ncbi:hypothetical protein CP533_6102 [Ophiocordyceps camponoti-saundersi (nom. inval.)]|nr:hypothetical protein CP533_6102 [Ophiocordyceps camponoti-saundersi (nom. inval.)]
MRIPEDIMLGGHCAMYNPTEILIETASYATPPLCPAPTNKAMICTNCLSDIESRRRRLFHGKKKSQEKTHETDQHKVCDRHAQLGVVCKLCHPPDGHGRRKDNGKP